VKKQLEDSREDLAKFGDSSSERLALLKSFIEPTGNATITNVRGTFKANMMSDAYFEAKAKYWTPVWKFVDENLSLASKGKHFSLMFNIINDSDDEEVEHDNGKVDIEEFFEEEVKEEDEEPKPKAKPILKDQNADLGVEASKPAKRARLDDDQDVTRKKRKYWTPVWKFVDENLSLASRGKHFSLKFDIIRDSDDEEVEQDNDKVDIADFFEEGEDEEPKPKAKPILKRQNADLGVEASKPAKRARLDDDKDVTRKTRNDNDDDDDMEVQEPEAPEAPIPIRYGGGMGPLNHLNPRNQPPQPYRGGGKGPLNHRVTSNRRY